MLLLHVFGLSGVVVLCLSGSPLVVLDACVFSSCFGLRVAYQVARAGYSCASLLFVVLSRPGFVVVEGACGSQPAASHMASILCMYF